MMSLAAILAFSIAFSLPVETETAPTRTNAGGNSNITSLSASLAEEEKSTLSVVAPTVCCVIKNENKHIHYTVKVGDTLSAIFTHFDLSYATLLDVLASDTQHLHLDLLKPGKTLVFEITNDGHLASMIYHITLVDRAIYRLNKEGEMTYRYEELASEWRDVLFSGEIIDNFSASARHVGLTPNQVGNITRALRRKIDFTRSLKAGDRFDILLEQQFMGDQLTGKTKIKAISFTLATGEVSAFLAQDGRFYDRNGLSLEGVFNRYPIDKQYRRITSAFNPKRKHPVTGRVTPHNGTDFATPVGAPIYSTGDGKVIAVRQHPFAGKYLVIEHNSVYKTRYLHLDKFLVTTGQQVKRGEKIALSGATGRLTGPHLHYEVLIHDRAVDPMTVSIPIASSIATQMKPSFYSNVAKFDAVVKENKQKS